jgi:hypothetical protein
LEVEVGVLLTGMNLDSIQAQFRVRLEEANGAELFREPVER